MRQSQGLTVGGGSREDRAVSALIGFILLFGILIVSFSIYQGFIIPQQNEQTEFDHNQKVQGELLNLRDGALRSGTTGVQQSSTIQVGAQFARRTFSVNLALTGGTLRTRDPSGESGSNLIRIRNVTALDDETADYLDGEINATTKSIEYEPGYTQYEGAPDTVITGGAASVINEHDEVNFSIADQVLVQDRTITVVSINGSLSKSKAGEGSSITAETRPLSVSTRSVTIRNKGGRINLTIPTRIDDVSAWNQSGIEEQFAPDGRVHAIRNDSANNVSVILKNGTYTLRMMQVGVGDGRTRPDAEYITDTDTPSSVAEETSTEFTYEVRDQFNNPMDGVQVNASIISGAKASAGSTVTQRLTIVSNGQNINSDSDTRIGGNTSDGRFVLNYTAPNVTSRQTVEINVSIKGDDGDRERVNSTFSVTDNDVNASDINESKLNTSGDARAGTGGVTDYTETDSERFTAKGGKWINVQNVQSINLSDPKFSPLKPAQGDKDATKEYFRLVFGVENDTHRYVFYFPDSKGGIVYQFDSPSSTSNRGFQLWNRTLGSGDEYDKLTDRAGDTTIPRTIVNDWHNGTRTIDLLNSSIYNDVDEINFDGVENLLNNSAGDATLFTFQVHGRVTMNLTEADFPQGAAAVSAKNINTNNQNVTFDLENGGSNAVTITGIAVNDTGDANIDRVGNGTKGKGTTYNDSGVEFLSTEPLLNVTNPLSFNNLKTLDTNSTIPGGGTVTYKLGEFRKNNNQEEGPNTPITITLYFSDGSEKTFKLS